MAGLAELFGLNTPQQPPAPPLQMAPTLAPDDATSQIMVPATTPQEIETRKAGWLEILDRATKDQNLMRAVGLAGASLAQPKPIGQTTAGMLANAYTVGRTAFDAGENQARQQSVIDREQARRDAESSANVAGTRARTGTEILRQPGVKADSEVAEATAADRIKTFKTQLEQAVTNLEGAKDKNAFDKANREYEKRLLEIKKQVPDQALLEGELAGINERLARARQANAQVGLTEANTVRQGAETREANAKASQQEITTDILRKMDPAEQKEFLTKTKRYSGHTSAISQQSDMWGAIYDKLPEDDPMKKGKTREQFQMQQLTTAKTADITKQMNDYIKAMDTANKDPDPEIVAGFSEAIKQSIAGRTGSAAKPAPGTTPGGAKTGNAKAKGGEDIIDMVRDPKTNKWVPKQ